MEQPADSVNVGMENSRAGYVFGLTLPVQQQRLYNFFAVGIGNGFKRGASAKRGNFLENPILEVPLHFFPHLLVEFGLSRKPLRSHFSG